jgi:hypothetical protein
MGRDPSAVGGIPCCWGPSRAMLPLIRPAGDSTIQRATCFDLESGGCVVQRPPTEAACQARPRTDILGDLAEERDNQHLVGNTFAFGLRLDGARRAGTHTPKSNP